MKNFDFTLIIITFKEYKNVFNLLIYLEKNEIKLNNIFIFSDSIVTNNRLCDITLSKKLPKIYYYKDKISKLNNVTMFNKNIHGGLTHIPLHLLEYLPTTLSPDENVIIMEDDMFIKSEFFSQCEYFFKNLYSEKSPFFSGFTKINSRENSYFETFNFLRSWVFSTKMKNLIYILQKLIDYRNYTHNHKEQIIHDIMAFTYPCEMFEKYKPHLINKLKEDFYSDITHLDAPMEIFILHDKLKIIKPTQSHILSFKHEPFNDISTVPSEADLQYILKYYNNPFKSEDIFIYPNDIKIYLT